MFVVIFYVYSTFGCIFFYVSGHLVSMTRCPWTGAGTDVCFADKANIAHSWLIQGMCSGFGGHSMGSEGKSSGPA